VVFDKTFGFVSDCDSCHDTHKNNYNHHEFSKIFLYVLNIKDGTAQKDREA